MMNSALLDIGGMTLRLEGDGSVPVVMALPGMSTFACTDGEPALHLSLDADIELPECRLLHRFDILEGSSECRFMVDAEGTYYYCFDEGELLRIDPRRKGYAECTALDLPEKLRFAIWLAYSMMAVDYGRLPIHSSTVVHDGRAVLCLGESGTGKSTHTRLWLNNIPQCHLLNDDSPILAATQEGAMVYGSPWSGKTHYYLQERYPVAALLRLEQRPQNVIHRLPTLEAFGAVQPSLPPSMAHDEHTLDALVSFASRIITTTPVYRLGCLPDADAAHLSHSTIYECDEH